MKFFYGLIEDSGKGKYLTGYGQNFVSSTTGTTVRIPAGCFEKVQKGEYGLIEKKGKYFVGLTEESRQSMLESKLEKFYSQMNALQQRKASLEAFGEDTKTTEKDISQLKAEYIAMKAMFEGKKNEKSEEYELEVIESHDPLIICNCTEDGKKKVYHTPDMKSYKSVEYDKKRVDLLVYTESQAKEAGFNPAV